MPQKPAPKDERKCGKKPGKLADLPAKSLKGKDAAKVKGGAVAPAPVITVAKYDAKSLLTQAGKKEYDW
jgi:hypothetical protein